MSVSAYKKTIKNTENPRDIERRILGQVTGKLENFVEEFDKSENKSSMLTTEIREAIWDNQRLWINVKADLMSPGNMLPDQLKGDLISLAIFIDKQSWLVMKGEGEIEPLIDVNKKIIAGLSGKAGG